MIERIQQAHALYCRLTGQRVSLRFDRERLWYELFQAGFNEADLQRVIRYLQREIREGTQKCRRSQAFQPPANRPLRRRSQYQPGSALRAQTPPPAPPAPPPSPKKEKRRANGPADAGPVSRRAGAVASTADSDTASSHQRLTVSRSDPERRATILLKTLPQRQRAFHSTAQSAHLPRCSTIYSAPHSTDQFAAVHDPVLEQGTVF